MSRQVSEPVPSPELQVRRAPQQDRAKETVEKILDATAELLDEAGHTKLTTKRVAKRSGVNIATLYNYFPNKLALLHALALRFAEDQQEELDAVYANLSRADWREVVDDLLDTILDFNRTTKGAVALSLAMRSYPALRQVDYARDKRSSEAAASRLAELGIKGDAHDLEIKALVIAEMMTAMVDYALEFYPERADAAMVEVKRMVKLYIEDLLRESGEHASSVKAGN